MKCWKDKCKNKLEFECPCTDPPTYSCDLHISGHLKAISKSGHRPGPLTIFPNEMTKRALITHLHKSLLNLYEFRWKAVSELSMQIQLLIEKMKITLNSFQKIIQKHQTMINQISSVEVISKQNNDNINEILSLEPKKSIEKLEEIFDIFGESEIFINDDGKITKKANFCLDERKEIIIFRDCTMKIVKTDLNNYLSTEFNIPLDNLKNMYISMCLIPENSVFCYGNYPTLANTAFIIDSNNNISWLTNAPVSLAASGSIYYKNCVYIFGGHGSEPVNNAFNYDLANKKWENLNSLPAPSHFLTCVSRKNKILLSGYMHSKIYCYDISQNSYIELHNAQANRHKLVCRNEQNYYVIELGGNIYESDHDWKIWRAIGTSGTEHAALIGFSVLWKNKIYFALHTYNLYEFCLKEKKIIKIKTI